MVKTGILIPRNCVRPWPITHEKRAQRFTEILRDGLRQHQDDTWTVETTNGNIDCDIVVNACGYRVNEVGAMMGVHHPSPQWNISIS